ncbi:MAG: hypothetical protein ACKOZT_09120 [Cyanobium sp.]
MLLLDPNILIDGLRGEVIALANRNSRDLRLSLGGVLYPYAR